MDDPDRSHSRSASNGYSRSISVCVIPPGTSLGSLTIALMISGGQWFHWKMSPWKSLLGMTSAGFRMPFSMAVALQVPRRCHS